MWIYPGYFLHQNCPQCHEHQTRLKPKKPPSRPLVERLEEINCLTMAEDEQGDETITMEDLLTKQTFLEEEAKEKMLEDWGDERFVWV